MSIQIGEKMPAGEFGVMRDGTPGTISSDELFTGKRVVLFAVPGAFTPTCSLKHLPGFSEQADSIRQHGIDTVACLSVNDTFVMAAWAKSIGVGENVLMLADGNGTYAKALDLVMDASNYNMGLRSQRFSMIVDDGVVTHLNVEPPGSFGLSSAETILEQLG